MKKFIFTIAALTVISLSVTITGCHKKKCGGGNAECICTQEYAPVCGSDNKTYGNACEAECKGVSYVAGECQVN